MEKREGGHVSRLGEMEGETRTGEREKRKRSGRRGAREGEKNNSSVFSNL